MAKLKRGYKPNSVRVMRAVFRSALHQAEKEGLIVRNVAALSTSQKLAQPDGRSLTLEEARRLLVAAQGDRLEALYAVTLILGLRRGEALGLSWEDLDLESGVVDIRRQMRRVPVDAQGSKEFGRRSQLVLKGLKTRKSRRVLHLTPALSAMLRTHRVRQASEKLAAGAEWAESDLVFTTPRGTALDPDNAGRYFQRLCAKAEIGKWHLHELRHSAASIMLAQGAPLHVVSEVLGHSSIAVTKDVYGHLVAGEKQAATESISAALL
ncbi:MAG: site-specific integrase [bacterium]|nr:site-specific integrase [bacterium]